MDAKSESDEDEETYYEILGIEEGATPQDIKKAFRKKARQLHPDKHPDEYEKYSILFQKVQEAHEILRDPEKRKLYDKYGKKGIKPTGNVGGGGDVFDMFFGGSSGGYSQNFTQQTSSQTMGFKVGGAKDINTFREKIKNDIMPNDSDITFNGNL